MGESFAATEFYSVREPSEILRAAVQFLSEGGWTVSSHSSDVVTFAQQVYGAGCAATVFLFLLGIIPGLLYLIFAKTTATVSVTSARDEEGSVTSLTWSEKNGQQACEAFWQMLNDQESDLEDDDAAEEP